MTNVESVHQAHNGTRGLGKWVRSERDHGIKSYTLSAEIENREEDGEKREGGV